MPSCVRLAFIPLACLTLSACPPQEKESAPAPAPAPSAPWPAETRASSKRSQRVGFNVVAHGEARFVLKTRRATHLGALRVARGKLEFDLLDLAATRGHVEIDLTSVRMPGEDGSDDRHLSSRAQSWLDVGASKPQAERERYRWARFAIEEVLESSADAAYEGRREKTDQPDAGTGQGGASAQVPAEIRIVNLTMKGRLRLHDREVVQVARLRAAFHYAAAATAGAVPHRIELTTRTAFPISLAAHDIRPRDSHGTVIARELKLLGTEVAREARVSLSLAAVPASE